MNQRRPEPTEISTAPKPDALAIAARLWPGPGPVEYCKRQAIAELLAFDRRLDRIRDLRGRAFHGLFPELRRLWIHRGESEQLLQELVAELRLAADAATSAIDLISSARMENEIRYYDEQIADRIARGVL